MARTEMDLQLEREQFLGLSTLEATRLIVQRNPIIRAVYLRPYHYIPDKVSGSDEVKHFWSRDAFISGRSVEDFISNIGEEYNVALDSTVLLVDGNWGHFAMMDLGPRKSEEALEKVTRRLKEILVPRFGGGVLLETKKSYHFLGFDPFENERFQEFLGRSLLTSIVTVTPDEIPNEHELIVDYRYVGHSLIRGTTGLRISAKGKKTVMPKVVEVI